MTLVGVMLAALLAMLDTTIVGTAMPSIVRALGGGENLTWVVTAYALATAVSTPVWAKAGDLYGRKGVFLASIAVFLAGSVTSGAAQSMGQLITFRVVQGLGAGGLVVGAFALIGALVPPRERARHQGTTASVMAIGTIGGPLLGGFLTDALGWRSAFYVNVPLGLVALVWCQVVLPRPVDDTSGASGGRRPRIDWTGALLLAVAVSSLLLLTTWGGQQYAWTSAPVLALAATAVAATTTFVVVERRVDEPLLPPRLFSVRDLSLVSVIAAVLGAVTFGAALYLPLFQQGAQHISASSSGLLLLPMLVPIVLASQVTGRVMSRTGRYRVFPILGALCLVAGLGLLATMRPTTSPVTTGAYMVLVGAGLGLAMPMTTTIAQNSVEVSDVGAASGAVTLFRTLGASLGVALFGVVGTRATGGAVLPGPGVLTRGVDQVFLAGALLSVLALVAALLLEEVPLRGGSPTPQAADRTD